MYVHASFSNWDSYALPWSPPDVKKKGKESQHAITSSSSSLPSFNLSHLSSSPSAGERGGAPACACVPFICWGCVWLRFCLDCYELMHSVRVGGCVCVLLIMKPYGLSVSMQAASTGSCDAGKKYRDETWGTYSCLFLLCFSCLSFIHLIFYLPKSFSCSSFFFLLPFYQVSDFILSFVTSPLVSHPLFIFAIPALPHFLNWHSSSILILLSFFLALSLTCQYLSFFSLSCSPH